MSKKNFTNIKQAVDFFTNPVCVNCPRIRPACTPGTECMEVFRRSAIFFIHHSTAATLFIREIIIDTVENGRAGGIHEAYKICKDIKVIAQKIGLPEEASDSENSQNEFLPKKRETLH